jgi:arylsulfatase
MDRAFLLAPAQEIIAKWLESFKDFPLRAKSASFSIDQVVESMMPKS